MNYRTEDQVRNEAGFTLGLMNSLGNNVETEDFISGVGPIITFIQLGIKLQTTDFVELSDKPDGWFLPFN